MKPTRAAHAVAALIAGWLLLIAPILATAGAPEPCTDFYAHATSDWLAANPIPQGQSRWSPRAVGRIANQRRLHALLEEAASRRDAPAGSAERIAGDMYASCMNEPAVEAAGLAPLSSLLAEIDAVRTPADVQRSLRRLHEIGLGVGFTAAGAPVYREPSRFVLNIAAGSFGLPRAAEERDTYRSHVASLLARAGAVDAADAASGVVALEARLAEGALDPAAAGDPAKTEHPMTFAQLVALGPAVDWAAYFEQEKLPRGELNVAEPRLVGQFERALQETPVAVWRSYLRFQLLEGAAPYLSRTFADESSAKGKPRADFCAETTEALLGDAVGRIFVERHFPPQDQARVVAMVQGLTAVLKSDLAGVSWMAPETRDRALDKLTRYDAQVGAPHRWAEQADLSIRREGLWANVASARRWAVAQDHHRIGRPTDRNVWQLPASSSGAYIDAQLNQIVLPAGFLLAIGFRSDADDPELYGGVGVGIAHDLTHAIDAGGADFDAQGRPVPWWSSADRARFQERAACVDAQYTAFEVEPGLHLDGKRVESEAVGDMGGVRLSYRALARALAARPVPPRDGVSAEQRFFIAWAQARAEAVRPETERQLARSDSHPPGRFRVLGTLANLAEFQEAFACAPGSKLVRPSAERCAVW